MQKEAVRADDTTRDCVAQVYFGMRESGMWGEILRRRIDWMVDQVRGPRVLDVGCSEGVLEILLARRGIEVTGVDIDADALRFARNLLEKEPNEVGKRVRLIQVDITRSELDVPAFDTVVMGEILEHLDNPTALLDRSMKFLRPGGRVVITTPFGFHPHEDHVQTFCLSNFLALVRARCAPNLLQVEEGYIRMVGTVSENPEPHWNQFGFERLMQMTETALVASQQRLFGQIHYQVHWKKQLEQQAKTRNHKIGEQGKKIIEQSKIISSAEERIETIKNEFNYRLALYVSRKGAKLKSYMMTPRKFLVSIQEAQQRRKKRRSSKEADKAQRARQGNQPADSAYIKGKKNSVLFPRLELPPIDKSERPVVAAILDTFSEYCLRYEANLLLLSSDNWREEMELSPPAFLLVESAWHGNNGSWQFLINQYLGNKESPLGELLQYCRMRNIKAVFWNKEDPPNFERFIDAAKEFDIVFTTDADTIPKYREICGHNQIFALPFAAQPKIHNPCRSSSWPTFPVCFAGSWMERHEERVDSLPYLLEPALQFGLHIYDRNYNISGSLPKYRFPDQFAELIKGTLNYEEMLTAYRCYKVMLNVNSVTDSPTMFSRRVFESLGCGTPVVSNDSEGMKNLLGNCVRISNCANETSKHLNELFNNEEACRQEAHLAYRFIHERHTYRHRMNEIVQRVGLAPRKAVTPSVSVVIATCRPEKVTHALESFSKQLYPEKELLLVLNNASFDMDVIKDQVEALENARVLAIEGKTSLGASLNLGIEKATGEFIAKMDDDDFYGERFLSDQMLAASYSNADIVGKGTYFVHLVEDDKMAIRVVGGEHQFGKFVGGGALVVRRGVHKEFPFEHTNIGEDTIFLKEVTKAGCCIYSADRFNYVVVRHADEGKHTWNIKTADFMKKCQNVQSGLDLSRVMI